MKPIVRVIILHVTGQRKLTFDLWRGCVLSFSWIRDVKNVPQSPAPRASMFTPERGELINLLYILASYLQTHPDAWDPSQNLRRICPFVLRGDLTSDQFCCDSNIR